MGKDEMKKGLEKISFEVHEKCREWNDVAKSDKFIRWCQFFIRSFKDTRRKELLLIVWSFFVSDRPETCKSTREPDFPFQHAIYNVTVKGGIRLRPGAPCNNFRGYCDIFHRCRRVDGDGPLRRLTSSLFSPEALQTAASWITVCNIHRDFSFREWKEDWSFLKNSFVFSSFRNFEFL